MGIRVSLRLGAFYEPPQAHPSREKDGDAGLQALRRQQEQAYALSRKTDAEAWKLASQHDYGGAKKLYEKLAADPRFKHMQNSIANQKQSVRDASEAYSFAMSGISTHFMGKTPITLGGKQYKIVGAKAGQLTLESGGKTTFMAIKDISGLDLFRLAYPGQKERGIEGYINLYRFAVMASDAKSLVPIVDKKLKDEDVDIHEAIIAILKPTLMVMTKPSRATIRVRSRNPNLDNRPVDSTPFFSVGMRDAKLNTTYVLEISKEGRWRKTT